MAELPPDGLWAITEPLRPAYIPSPDGRRPPITHRRALAGILFVLKTGLPWEGVPAGTGCGSGMACRRRLAAWQADGTRGRVHAALPERPAGAGELDWSRCAIDSSSAGAA